MMNSTVHDDDNDDDDCDNYAWGCDDGCSGNHDIRYIMFDKITATATVAAAAPADVNDYGGMGCDS